MECCPIKNLVDFILNWLRVFEDFSWSLEKSWPLRSQNYSLRGNVCFCCMMFAELIYTLAQKCWHPCMSDFTTGGMPTLKSPSVSIGLLDRCSLSSTIYIHLFYCRNAATLLGKIDLYFLAISSLFHCFYKKRMDFGPCFWLFGLISWTSITTGQIVENHACITISLMFELVPFEPILHSIQPL